MHIFVTQVQINNDNAEGEPVWNMRGLSWFSQEGVRGGDKQMTV